ncbi:hypothetical protein AMJ80_02575 [bacterium SM23_31]|nr:MAG: hypothetical protein AMJ80_02575 [bacterium SM23_31]
MKALAAVRDLILAYKFGQGALTDAYFIAFHIPHTLMYVMGITLLRGMSSSIFSESIAKKQYDNLSVIFSTIFNAAFIVTAVISIICVWQMPAIIRLLPFTFQEASFEMIVLMGRILFPLIITLGLSDYLGATLNAFRNFFLPGFSMIAANICMILSLIYFADKLSILSLAYGTAAGFILACAIQFVFIVRSKIHYKFNSFNLNLPPVRSFLRKSMPLLLVTGFGQITMLIGYIIALNIEEGMVSALSYAGKINDISLSLFVLPLLTVLLPEFARDKAANNIDALKSHIRFGAEVIASIIVLWAAFLIVFHREIIMVYLQRGEFSASDAYLTGKILLIYMIGLCFLAGNLFLKFIYLGMQKTEALTIIGVITYTINILLLFVLSKIYGVYGLAWAASITAFIYCLLLLITFKTKYIQFSLLRHGRNLMKIIGAGIIIFLLFNLARSVVITDTETTTVITALKLMLIGIFGGIIYMGMLHFFRIFLFDEIFTGIKRYIHGQN